MEEPNLLSRVFAPSKNVVARKIEDELIIVPIVSGIADAEYELFTLNETGQELWEKLDGVKTLEEIVAELREIFEDSRGEIEKDVMGLTEELLNRGLLSEVSSG